MIKKKTKVSEIDNKFLHKEIDKKSFDKDYFIENSTYARFDDIIQARSAMMRWYSGLFSFLDGQDGGLLSLPRPIIEFGCGHGAVLELLIQRGMNPIGTDISHWILSQTQTETSSPLLVEDLSHIAFRTGSVGTSIALEVLEHVPDPLEALSEINRILLPGGRLIATTPNPWADILPMIDSSSDATHVSVKHPLRWKILMQEIGFDQVEVINILEIPFFWRYSKILSKTIKIPFLGPTSLLLARKK